MTFLARSKAVVAVTLLAMLPAVPAAGADPAWVDTFETGLRPMVRTAGEEPPRWTLAERMAHYRIPGVSIAVIRDGEIVFARGYGERSAGGGDPVTTDTVFSVGSVSKIGTAATALRLVADGRLDLDQSVNERLTSWRVPQNHLTQLAPVTLRGLLTHTAGLSLHGFPDFLPGEALPSIIDTLDGRPPSRTEPVRAIYVPGSAYKYSGGGTTVAQLLISDVTETPFDAVAERELFMPLGMTRSTYQNPLPEAHGDIARAHDASGQPTALPRGWHSFPETGASGLWTTPSDLAKMLIAFVDSYLGEERAFLPQPLAMDLMASTGQSAHGLGPIVEGTGQERRFFHSGANDSYKAWIEGHLATGDGVAIVTNGPRGNELYAEMRRALAEALDWPHYGELVAPAEVPRAPFADQLPGTYEIRPPQGLIAQRMLYVGEGMRLRFAERSGRLFLSVSLPDMGNAFTDAFPLTPLGPTEFLLPEALSVSPHPRYVEFVRDSFNRVSQLIMREGPYAVVAQRL